MTDDAILITPKQLEAVLRLDGPKRYRIFIPDGRGVIPTVEELRGDILEELDHY